MLITSEPASASISSRPVCPRGERGCQWAFAAAFFCLALFFAFRGRVDSDEPQHLHVVWSRAQGLVQYRDFFDNHAPLFHMLFSPAVRVLGDRADLLILMRLPMIALMLATLACVYWIGRRLVSQRVGLWSAAIAGLFPVFLEVSCQFRSDVLWTTFWLAALAVLLHDTPNARRSFLAGLCLGATLAVSLKTSYLLAALVGAAAPVAVLAWRRGAVRGRWFLVNGGSLAAGLVVAMGAMVAVIWRQGMLQGFYNCAIAHNMNLGRGMPLWRLATALGMLLITALAAPSEWRRSPGQGAYRRVFLVLLGGTLLAALWLWPVQTAQDFLPIFPVLAVVLANLLLQGLAPVPPGRRWQLAASAAAIEVILLVISAIWGADNVAKQLSAWRDVLRLTDPNQTVMDSKGELIFRRRGCWPVMETITAAHFKQGLLVDDIAQQLIEHQTCVASARSRANPLFPPGATRFMQENYLCVGSLCVAGKFLSGPQSTEAASTATTTTAEPSSTDGVISFDVRLPARYAIITPEGPAGGFLDGHRYDGPVQLSCGPHEYRPAASEGRLALAWAQAVERGFSPQWTSK